MSSPSNVAAAAGTAASAGVTLNEWVSVDIKVSPQANGDIMCDVVCNGREVTVNFAASGDVDLDVKEENPQG